MTTHRKSVLVACTLLCAGLTALPAPTQTRHVVPDQFPSIQAAIDAASPGDYVLVRPRSGGAWPAFTLQKPLTILGWPGPQPGSFAPRVECTARGASVHVRLRPDERAALVGLTILEDLGSAGGFAPVEVRGGTVTIEDCRIHGGRTTDPAVRVAALDAADATLQLVRSALEGEDDGVGLLARRSDVVLMNLLVEGGRYADAVVLEASSLKADACTIIGGPFDRANGPAGHGLVVDATSRAWIAESRVTGGVGLLGGTGVVNLGTQPVAWARTTVQGGSGAVPGPVSSGPVAPDAPLLGVFRPTPPFPDREALRAGAPFVAIYRGEPGVPMLVLGGNRLAAARTDPWVEQPVTLPAAWFVVHAGLLDAQGELTLRYVVPNDPALLECELRLFGFAGATLPIQAAAPTGGFIRR